MTWEIKVTDTFSKEFKKHKKDGEFVKALEAKLDRLKENPENVGGYLSGRLHGYKSTRIVGKYRLVFKIVREDNSVKLMAIDHRKFDYERFGFD
ncbi:type II toxin-antitoxin system mRNA interferase toxin, RelE/StbE family [Candidatus Woesearchaeota archaeon]|nr:type II toxin-antitoxin system mRNA interferase toxin, RelE/StbE family [Candidatus Woesearchaeota archaeon]